MNIEFRRNGRELTIIPGERIDTLTAPELDQKLKAEVADANVLIFDLVNVNYISSAGLRVLLFYAQEMMEMDGNVKAIHVNEYIRDIFDLAGFLEILNVD